METAKENMIRDIINNSPFYDNPDELRIRDFKSVKFIHNMIPTPKCKFVHQCSLAHL